MAMNATGKTVLLGISLTVLPGAQGASQDIENRLEKGGVSYEPENRRYGYPRKLA
ncbi:MAG TPA: hypothetical protein VM616_09135 [Gammaproteobacteria bacterium]|nr:hypothetical protein [Gammaproteobacteria bacterium]